MPNSLYENANAITNLKKIWHDADAAGDNKKKQEAQSKAQEYYKKLRDSGNGDVADQLAATNYGGALAIKDKLAKQGRTSTRDYFYSLGKGYGMSQNDIDNLIKWDDATEQVYFDGKLLGRPDGLGIGVSYWNDTKVLDDAFNDYIKRSGTTLSDEEMSKRNTAGVYEKMNDLWGMQSGDHTDLTNMWKQEYNDLKKTNPFTTDEAKAILGKYDLAGLQGRDNAVASGSATNGGNIDSFAAANAMRQQASLVNQGQMAVLEAHNQKLENARAILEGLGAYQQGSYAGMQNTIGLQQKESQRLFENSETAKQSEFDRTETAANNKTDRLVKQAGVTGYTPIEWVIQNDAFLKQYVDDNGKLKKEAEGIDFQALINDAKAKGQTELADKWAILRGLKISGNPKEFGKWLNSGDIKYVSSQITEDARQFDKQDATALEAIKSEAEMTKYGIDSEKEVALDANAKNLEGSIHADNTGLEATKIQSETEKYKTDANKEVALDTNAKQLEESIHTDNTGLEGIKIQSETEKYKTDADNKNELDKIRVTAEVQQEIAQLAAEGKGVEAYNVLWNALGGYNNWAITGFLDDKVLPILEKGGAPDIRALCLNPDNISHYGYTYEDVETVFRALEINTDGLKTAFEEAEKKADKKESEKTDLLNKN